MTQFAIIIPTYQRADGKTPYYLKRCIDSVLGQTYADFRLFIVGDKYTNDSEILPIIPKSAYYRNLPIAPERDRYLGYRLWCCGGCNALKHGIRRALDEGFEYLIVLDHDDYWAEHHLQMFSENAPFSWACTRSTFKDTKILPVVDTTNNIFPFVPQANKLIKSSACWNYSDLPLSPRNVFEETGVDCPGDADLWERMAVYIEGWNLHSLCINEITCFHDTEGYTLNNK